MKEQIQIARTLFAGILLCAAVLFISISVAAQPRTEYRAFWIDTFNTVLNTPADVTAVVGNAQAAKANALFVQVRRRGDSWYLNSLEPAADRTPIQAGFDPLQDIIDKAHAQGIEIHAFVVMSAVWGRAPNLFPPENPNHVFNQHGGFDSATNTIIPGPNNWLTRTLLPDGTGGVTYQGHRIGSDFWVDFGHPDAAKYTVDVVRHLVQNYNIDGLHIDRIRYPEIGVTGQTPTTGTSIGYNTTSVERFQRYYNIPAGSPPPAQNDPQWNQWRRDQVTNVVRRVYLDALAIKPQLKVSAALIAFGGIGSTETSWNSSEAYWRVYQDWRAWTQEGITDIAIPMAYKNENVATTATQYDQWNAWLRGHLYNRAGILGQGGLSNAVEGTLRQTRRTLTPAGGTNLSGIIYYSMASSNVAITNNLYAIPAPVNTPVRPFAELASGLTTGKSVDNLTLYEPAGQTPIFAETANIPVLPWKAAPTVGHIKGFAKRADNSPLDTAVVTIRNLDTNLIRTGATDGGGFYGGVDLPPGQYLVKAVLNTETLYSAVVNVTAGTVVTADVIFPNAPTSVLVTVSGRVMSPNGRGIAKVRVSISNPTGETRTVLTNAFGYFSFTRIPAGTAYTITPTHRRIQFSPASQTTTVNEDLTGIEFAGISQIGQRQQRIKAKG